MPNHLIGLLGSRDMAYLAKLPDTLRRRLVHSLTKRRIRQGMAKDCRLTALPASLGDAAML